MAFVAYGPATPKSVNLFPLLPVGGAGVMADTPIRIRLDSDDFADLVGLAEFASRLPLVLAGLEQVGIHVNPFGLADRVSRKSSLPEKDVSRSLRVLNLLYHTRQSLELTATETIDAVSYNLARLAKGQEQKDQLKVWESAKNEIARVLDSLDENHPLIVSGKAFRSVASRSNVVVDMDISINVLPVFDNSGSRILMSVISHVLNLEYHTGPDHQHSELAVSMDYEDIIELRDLCDKAANKAKVLRDDLAKTNWPSSILMGPEDAESSEAAHD